jgi:exopolysaccharide biosynthesis protein
VTLVRAAALLLGLSLLSLPDGRAQERTSSAASARDVLGTPERVADGIDLYRLDEGGLTSPPSPQSVRLLRLDPRHVRLASALATGEIPGRATVPQIAQRAGALVAINAGFFSPTGDPTGALKLDGRLLSDTRRARGAVGFIDGEHGVLTLFDQVSARVRLRFRSGGAWRTVAVDGVDTVRGRDRLVLYSPASGATTDTTAGLEWTLAGAPLRASSARNGGNSAIPEGGYVLSFGGNAVPPALSGLTRATSVQVREALDVRSGTRVRDWQRARTIVGGAGLLLRGGRRVSDWTQERLSRGFDTTRHPRTVIARDRQGAIWLLAIDGRRPERALGMTFAEMQAFLARLGMVDALNLDGGGSTTMVVKGEIVNRPSDLTGARPVSDAIIVTAR